MTAYAIADMHGRLPYWHGGDGDLLLIGGDVCPDYRPMPNYPYDVVDKTGQRQAHWLDTMFRRWLERIRESGAHVVGIWGNHDFVGEHPYLVPDLPWILLQDQTVEVAGLRIHGTPWVPNLRSWAFYGSSNSLDARAKLVPDDLDVLVSHGPPHGAGDEVPGAGPVGDPSLNEAIERVRPTTVVCGHIHEGMGKHRVGDTPIYNTSYVDENYRPYSQAFHRLVEFD